MLYGSHLNIAAMLHSARSHQLGKGHPNNTAVSILNHPSRLVYESQGSNAEMPMRYRSQGKGRHRIAEMPSTGTPFPPVYGSPCYHAAMPIYDRSHFLTRGHLVYAAMPFLTRLSREGSSWPRRNAIHGSPFPTSLWEGQK